MELGNVTVLYKGLHRDSPEHQSVTIITIITMWHEIFVGVSFRRLPIFMHFAGTFFPKLDFRLEQWKFFSTDLR